MKKPIRGLESGKRDLNPFEAIENLLQDGRAVTVYRLVTIEFIVPPRSIMYCSIPCKTAPARDIDAT
jgi:hypothetical protein